MESLILGWKALSILPPVSPMSVVVEAPDIRANLIESADFILWGPIRSPTAVSRTPPDDADILWGEGERTMDCKTNVTREELLVTAVLVVATLVLAAFA